MRKSLFLSIVLITIYSCKDNRDHTTEENSNKSWNLVFEDDFNDLEAWDIWYGGAFNEEIQLYREEQLSITDGILSIKAERLNITGPTRNTDETPKEFEYVSGRIESKQLFGPSDQDGEREYRFVSRLKLPAGKGMWPAYWLYGDPWPTQGEIDILEARGSEPDRFQSNIFYGTKPGININQHSEAFFTIGENLTEEFHVYEMIWRPKSIDIIFDGKVVHEYKANRDNNIKKLLGTREKLVFNTAVGGWFLKDRDSNNYADSSTMQVDWVKVYKR